MIRVLVCARVSRVCVPVLASRLPPVSFYRYPVPVFYRYPGTGIVTGLYAIGSTYDSRGVRGAGPGWF